MTRFRKPPITPQNFSSVLVLTPLLTPLITLLTPLITPLITHCLPLRKRPFCAVFWERALGGGIYRFPSEMEVGIGGYVYKAHFQTILATPPVPVTH